MSRPWKAVFLLAITIAAISTGATKYTAGGGYYGEAGTSYSGSLSEYKGYATVSIPFRGTVNANQLEECDFRMDDGEIVVYGYNTRNGGLYERSNPLIHGTRGNIVAVEDDCQFSINTDEDIEPLDDSVNRLKGTPQDGWLLYSPVNDRDVSGLESAVAASGQNCDLIFVDGNPTYRFTLDGNDPLGEGDTMQSDRTYWVGTTGFGCGIIGFGDIPPPTVDNPEDTTADSGSETDNPASDADSGNDEPPADGELRLELYDAQGQQMSGGAINVEDESHSSKDFISTTYQEIEVPEGQELELSITCGEAELNSNVEVETGTKNIELLLDKQNSIGLCSQYEGDFSERSKQEEFDVRQSNPRTEPTTLRSADYEFSVANGDKRITFGGQGEIQEQQLDSFEQDRKYELLFSLKAYRPGTSSTVDVFTENTEMSVQGPGGAATNGNCAEGLEHRCNTPGFAELFVSGDYTIELIDTEGSNPEIIERATVTLPEAAYT